MPPSAQLLENVFIKELLGGAIVVSPKISGRGGEKRPVHSVASHRSRQTQSRGNGIGASRQS
jgi:hypothetical protein